MYKALSSSTSQHRGSLWPLKRPVKQLQLLLMPSPYVLKPQHVRCWRLGSVSGWDTEGLLHILCGSDCMRVSLCVLLISYYVVICVSILTVFLVEVWQQSWGGHWAGLWESVVWKRSTGHEILTSTSAPIAAATEGGIKHVRNMLI